MSYGIYYGGCDFVRVYTHVTTTAATITTKTIAWTG